MAHISRRRLLQTGATTIATAGIAGCLGQGGASLDSVTVAYVPIYPNMQHYVMEQEGYYEDVPADVTIERFSSGPSVVKAFASGDVDVALFGITPAMVLVDKGTDAGVLAANSRNGFKVMGTTELADLYEQEGPATFERFEQEHGRKIRFGAPPDGSVPDIVLRYWIQEDLDIGEMESAIDKSKVPPAKAVQTIQSGDIDATIIQEPFATIIGQNAASANSPGPGIYWRTTRSRCCSRTSKSSTIATSPNRWSNSISQRPNSRQTHRMPPPPTLRR